MPEPLTLLEKLLEARLTDAARFFERAQSQLAAPGVGLRALFASVPRRLGKLAQEPASAPAELTAARPHWTLSDCMRLWLLLRALPNVAEAEQATWLVGLFEGGEIGEQVSVLRVLS